MTIDEARGFGVPRLTAKSKLDEARFFLGQLQHSGVGSLEFRNNCSACVSALYSVIQHLLFDYVRIFWPQIDPSEYIDLHSLALLGKTSTNMKAREFVEWYSKLQGRMNSDPDTRAALNVRTMEIHRMSTPLFFDVAFWEPPIDVTDRMEYGIKNSQGTVTPSGAQMPTPRQLESAGQGSKTVVYFSSYKNREIPAALEAAINFIDSLIKEAESQFGPPVGYKEENILGLTERAKESVKVESWDHADRP